MLLNHVLINVYILDFHSDPIIAVNNEASLMIDYSLLRPISFWFTSDVYNVTCRLKADYMSQRERPLLSNVYN
jgi:hypothetical protein